MLSKPNNKLLEHSDRYTSDEKKGCEVANFGKKIEYTL